MKVRKDFVTNSSSSSFILGFKSKEDMKNIADELPYYWAEAVRESVSSDVEYGVTTKEKAIELYQDCLWTSNWKFYGKDYWGLTKEERQSEEYKKFIQDKKDKLSEDLLNKLNEYEIISIVEYGDHTSFGSELEHNIMPYLDCTIESISHH